MTEPTICRECQGRVSIEAFSCVHCGAPLRTRHVSRAGRMIRIAVLALFCAQAIGVGLIIAERGGIQAGLAEISLWLALLACIGVFAITRDRASSPISSAIHYKITPAPR